MTKKKKYFLTILFPFIFLIIFISVILIKAPIKQTFEYDPDEGFELMKSALFLKGFSLYKEIYSDQPPLFTLILSNWFKLFGLSAYNGRILILIFSGILLWAFYGIVKNLWGDFCAFIAVTLLILSQLYLRLSISIMIGTVALSLAMVSIYCITLYRKSCQKYLLILSGIFLALSLQAKLFTAFLIPLIALEIMQAKWIGLSGARKLRHFLPPLLLWFGSLLTVSLVFIAVFFHFNLSLINQQLIQPHLKRIIVPGSDFFIIWQMILADYDIALLALIGIILLIKQRKWQFFFPVLWLGMALFILAIYRPVWEHYYLLVSIPICWLAAISFSEFLRVNMRQGWFARKNKYSAVNAFLHWLTGLLIIITIVMLPYKFNKLYRSIWAQTALKEQKEEQKIVELLLKYKKYANWIFTDRPIFAFYTNILVPPELVLVTEKRGFTNTDTQAYLIDKIEKYKPEMILLERLDYFGPQAISYIQTNYSEIYKTTLPDKYSHCPFHTLVWRWEPIGKYLPQRIQIITDKWVYNMIWHSIRIPIFLIMKPLETWIESYKLYIRNDIFQEILYP